MSQMRFQGLECLQGDLTEESTDAIVNAASTGLRGGGGVDGAIHRAAGPGLLAELVERYPEGCPTGEARLTGGHALAAKFIIHTPGPVWRGGGHGEAELLERCYQSALDLAREHGLTSLAFPAISAGTYRFPLPDAARIALTTLARGLARDSALERVRCVLFSDETLAVYRTELQALGA